MSDRIVEFQTYTKLPALDPGGHLEQKEGEVCLRMGDEVAATLAGFVVRRVWYRPGRVPFDKDLYPVRGGGQ